MHDLITIESPVALPELARFRVDRLDFPARIRIEFGRVPALPTGMGCEHIGDTDRLSYRERAGFSVVYDFGETTVVTASPFLRHSPHVLYTNCTEPLLRWTFAEMGFALVHAACVTQGDRAFLITARTDTGKTTTILKALDHNPGLGFVSDDLTLVHADGRVLTYPKPLTISQHTLHAVRTPNLTRGERAALVVQARLHSRGGRSIGMALFEHGLPGRDDERRRPVADPAAEVRRREADPDGRRGVRGAPLRHGRDRARRRGQHRAEPGRWPCRR